MDLLFRSEEERGLLLFQNRGNMIKMIFISVVMFKFQEIQWFQKHERCPCPWQGGWK